MYYFGIMAMRWENIMAAAELHRLRLRPPAVSWGVLLQQVQNVRTLAGSPWLLIPALFVAITVLCFNFLGDGLRDATDSYRST